MTPFQKIVILLYRYMAGFVLLTILGTGGGYAFVTLFYTFNSTWAAPVLLSQTNDKILQLTGQVLRTEQGKNALDVEIAGLEREIELREKALPELVQLGTAAQTSLEKQGNLDAARAKSLTAVYQAKQEDIARTTSLLKGVSEQEAAIAADLKAGLITKLDASKALASLNASQVAATDAVAQGTALGVQVQDLNRSASTLRDGAPSSPVAVDQMLRLAQAQSHLAETQAQVLQSKQSLQNKKTESAKLGALLETLRESPYIRATASQTPLSFAFVPFDNDDSAALQTPVYACKFQIIWCNQVGTLVRKYSDEERAKHPLFHTDIRGSLIELTLSTPEAAKSKVIWLGSAPLFF